jgi:hypothetical protein
MNWCCETVKPGTRLRDWAERSERELDERATGQPQGLESEAYLNSTSQGSRPEDARKDVHIHGRSSRFMNYPG